MFGTKFFGVAVAAIAVVIGMIVTAGPAHADCGDPGQPPCTGPAPTTDEVDAILTKMTDPTIAAANKTTSSPPDSSPTKPRQSMIIRTG